MVTRYDITVDEMIEVTQEYFNMLQKRLKNISLHYKQNDPDNFEKFCNNYILTSESS